MDPKFVALQNLVNSIDYQPDWLLSITLDANGKIKSWKGFPEKFGFSKVSKSAHIEDLHPVFSNLFPIKTAGLYLPRIQTELNRFVNIYIYHEKGDFIVFIEDSTYEAKIVKESYDQIKPINANISNPFNREALSVFNASVLQHFKDSMYYPLGIQPDWFYKLFPLANKAEELINVKDLSIFLDSFLCQNIAEIRDLKTIHSDVWIEVDDLGKEYFLQLTMLYYNDEKYIFIKNLTEYFDDKQSQLQKSRENALNYERLKKTEAHLKKLLKFKEKFVSIVSHDFRSPLSGFLGLVDFLLSDEEFIKNNKEEHVQILSLIQKELGVLMDYNTKLYNWSNLSHGNFILTEKTINLAELINRKVAQFSTRINDKELNVRTNLNYGIDVTIDDTLFAHVINNLLDNAIKFTPEKGTITLSLTKQDDKVIFKVTDSGVGMSPVVQSKIFEEYVDEHTQGTKGEMGSGIGLSIVKSIVDAHNFEISFNSKENEGTEFVITM